MSMGDFLARNAVHIGDVRELAARLEPQSVQTIVTSPPYWGLRDYGTGTWEGGDPRCEHKVRTEAHAESSTLTGAKATVGHQREGYKGRCGRCGASRIDRQLGLESTPEEFVANLVGVFRALWPALKGDGTLWLNLGDSYAGNQGGAQGKTGQRATRTFTASHRVDRGGEGLKDKDLCGIPWMVAFALRADGWYLRSDIIWAKPNPMPESVTDRPTRAHEYIFLLAKQPRYFYDATAIQEASVSTHPSGNGYNRPEQLSRGGRGSTEPWTPAATRNRRSVWTIGSAMFPDAHYATFPPALVRPCILAGSKPGDLVLDPFMGSGTVAQVCHELGRDWQGFDLDERAIGWTAARLATMPVGTLFAATGH